jgi:hypothetical protein
VGTSSSARTFYFVDDRKFYFWGERAIFLNFGFDSYTIGIFTSSETSLLATLPENYDIRFSSVKYSSDGCIVKPRVATCLAFLREGGG